MPFVRRASGPYQPSNSVDDGGSPITVMADYLAHGVCSRSTATAYAHDLLHFGRFSQAGLAWEAVAVPMRPASWHTCAWFRPALARSGAGAVDGAIEIHPLGPDLDEGNSFGP